MATRTPTKTETKIKKGDLMAVINWVRVTGVTGNILTADSVDDATLKGIEIRGKELIDSCFSANLFEKEEKITKTAAAEKLCTAYNRPFTVCFIKEDGTERTLQGRLISHEAFLGRSQVEDLEITSGHRMRLVDHRTIKWLIVDNVKYVVK